MAARVDGKGTTFRVWAEKPKKVELVIGERKIAMKRQADGYWEARVDGVGEGTRYAFLLDGERRRPDPESRAQPDGVHADSQVIGPLLWKHERPRRPFHEWVIYELHVGTFTREGTFEAAAREFSRLRELGVNAIEVMPVNAFPGRRNWGYDGVYWMAVQQSYGGPAQYLRMIDAAHGLGLAIIQDVVFNHLGPEGNYLPEFGDYFTDKHHTPWGAAIDYQKPAVRSLVLETAKMFADDYRVDALRLDAVHAIADDSPRHIVAELAASLEIPVIAESDLGDVTVIEEAGWNCRAQWADDLHHALHAALTGERQSYYADYGPVELVARAINDGFAWSGEFSRYRGRNFGTPAKHLPGERFVVCAQNHDQVGNRGMGERLHQLVPGCEKAAAATYLLSPLVPMIFMGEEDATPSPFLYFTDHQDRQLAQAVREGRLREHGGVAPDPQAPETFEKSKISTGNPEIREFYRTLLRLRRERPALRALDKTRTDARAHGEALTIRRWTNDDEILAVISLSKKPARVEIPAPRFGRWVTLAGDGRLDGTTVELPPLQVLLLAREAARPR